MPEPKEEVVQRGSLELVSFWGVMKREGEGKPWTVVCEDETLEKAANMYKLYLRSSGQNDLQLFFRVPMTVEFNCSIVGWFSETAFGRKVKNA